MSRVAKSIETERKLVTAWGWWGREGGLRRNGQWLLMDMGFFLGWWKGSKIDCCVMAQLCEYTESHGLYTVRRWIVCYMNTEEQNKTPNMPFQHIDYFELKLLKKKLVQEELSTPSLSPWKQEIKNLLCEAFLPISGILITWDREFKAQKAISTNFVTSSLICYLKPKLLCFVKFSQIIVYLS